MTPLTYSIRDSQDRDVTPTSTPPATMSAARRIARLYGPGAVVLGARGQVVYTVKRNNKEKAK